MRLYCTHQRAFCYKIAVTELKQFAAFSLNLIQPPGFENNVLQKGINIPNFIYPKFFIILFYHTFEIDYLLLMLNP